MNINKRIGMYSTAMKTEHDMCLVLDCTKKSCKAHSIQNSVILDLLCYKGHVVCITPFHEKQNGPKYIFKEIGRKKASTFRGLCNEHDTKIFQPIEKWPLLLELPSNVFLFAYRSIFMELHAKIQAAKQANIAYKELLSFDPNSVTALESFSAALLFEAYCVHKHKLKYDFI
jgi:hypothetical protein